MNLEIIAIKIALRGLLMNGKEIKEYVNALQENILLKKLSKGKNF